MDLGKKSKRRSAFLILAAVLICGGVGIGVLARGREDTAVVYTAKVVNTFPHDPTAYCQGLIFVDGVLFEGTGKYGQSVLRRVDLASGKPELEVRLSDKFFGEGIALWNDQIIQLTWKEKVAFVYNKATLAKEGEFKYTGQGWGLTHDGSQLILSDGTPVLRLLDPKTFKVTKRITVRNNGIKVNDINELEYINGEIWANVWYQDYLIRISPQSGEVLGYVDLRHLWPVNQRPDRDCVLNGIAYDEKTKRLFVTGKYWPNLFEIEVTRR